MSSSILLSTRAKVRDASALFLLILLPFCLLEYLFDWSLPLNCPELMKGLRIPEYFTDNILQRTPESTLYRDSWPSLFIAPAGITSELHVDAFGSNFWMALFEGRKRCCIWDYSVVFSLDHMSLLF